VKDDEMGLAYSTNGGEKEAYRLMTRKLERKRPLGSLRHRWVDNTRMDLGEIE
jgi:hypothetical protein